MAEKHQIQIRPGETGIIHLPGLTLAVGPQQPTEAQPSLYTPAQETRFLGPGADADHSAREQEALDADVEGTTARLRLPNLTEEEREAARRDSDRARRARAEYSRRQSGVTGTVVLPSSGVQVVRTGQQEAQQQVSVESRGWGRRVLVYGTIGLIGTAGFFGFKAVKGNDDPELRTAISNINPDPKNGCEVSESDLPKKLRNVPDGRYNRASVIVDPGQSLRSAGWTAVTVKSSERGLKGRDYINPGQSDLYQSCNTIVVGGGENDLVNGLQLYENLYVACPYKQDGKSEVFLGAVTIVGATKELGQGVELPGIDRSNGTARRSKVEVPSFAAISAVVGKEKCADPSGKPSPIYVSVDPKEVEINDQVRQEALKSDAAKQKRGEGDGGGSPTDSQTILDWFSKNFSDFLSSLRRRAL